MRRITSPLFGEVMLCGPVGDGLAQRLLNLEAQRRAIRRGVNRLGLWPLALAHWSTPEQFS